MQFSNIMALNCAALRADILRAVHGKLCFKMLGITDKALPLIAKAAYYSRDEIAGEDNSTPLTRYNEQMHKLAKFAMAIQTACDEVAESEYQKTQSLDTMVAAFCNPKMPNIDTETYERRARLQGKTVAQCKGEDQRKADINSAKMLDKAAQIQMHVEAFLADVLFAEHEFDPEGEELPIANTDWSIIAKQCYTKLVNRADRFFTPADWLFLEADAKQWEFVNTAVQVSASSLVEAHKLAKDYQPAPIAPRHKQHQETHFPGSFNKAKVLRPITWRDRLAAWIAPSF